MQENGIPELDRIIMGFNLSMSRSRHGSAEISGQRKRSMKVKLLNIHDLKMTRRRTFGRCYLFMGLLCFVRANGDAVLPRNYHPSVARAQKQKHNCNIARKAFHAGDIIRIVGKHNMTEVGTCWKDHAWKCRSLNLFLLVSHLGLHLTAHLLSKASRENMYMHHAIIQVSRVYLVHDEDCIYWYYFLVCGSKSTITFQQSR